MTLRSDVKFHDGTPFNAAAVKANIDEQLTSATSTTKPLLAAIDSVDAVDDTTVRLHLKTGHGSEVLANLATNAGAMISPKALADTTLDLSKQPGNSGSGAYLIAEYDPTTHVNLKHSPDTYWDPNAGKLAEIDITVIAKTSGRLDAVTTGEVDLAHLQLPEAQDALTKAAAGGYSVFKVENFLSAHDIILNSSNPSLSDVRVRQALAYGVDREGIASGLLNNGCTVNNQLYPPSHWAASKNIPSYDYNVAKAKDLLTQAGVSNLKLDIGYAAGTPFELLATAVKDQWSQIGVEATLKPYATAADANKAFLAGEFPAFEGSLVGVPEPDTMVRQYFLGGYNLIKEPALKAEAEADAVAAVDPSLDLKGRAAAYEKLWLLIAAQVWNIRICNTFQTYAFNPKVQGVDQMGLVYSGFFDARSLSIKP
jgi:peptide/nickel transport system substrate-binding protein